MVGLLGEDFGPEDALFLETERPGFSQSKLLTVPEGATSYGETKIPQEFWEACKQLESGNEEPVLDKAVIVSSLSVSK